MKIAFVNDCWQNLGIQYISSILKKNGHDTRLFIDPQLFDDWLVTSKKLNKFFDYKRTIISDLKHYKPDLIGISVITDFYQWACQMARMIKEEMDVPIIFGGIHPTSVPERVIKNDFVDIVCVGEGEYPMLELINSMEKGSIDYSIKNLWFKRDGEIIKNDIRPLIEDLDSLPMPDKDLFYFNAPRFIKTYPYLIATDRGCPNSCSYCCHSYLRQLYQGKGQYLRRRSVQHVIRELELSKDRYGFKYVAFQDDSFGHDINWLRDFSYEYKRKVNAKYICAMGPGDITEESIKYLKDSGCSVIALGIQTWDTRLRLEVFNRNVTNQVMENAIRLIKKAEIEIAVDNIIGIPGQSNEDLIQSVKFYTQVKPTRIYFFKLQYYPKTLITRNAEINGWLSPEKLDKKCDGRNTDILCVKLPIVNGGEGGKEFIKTEILLFLLGILPARLSKYIIKHKLYRHFPTVFDPYIFVLFTRLLSFDAEARIYRLSTIYRYSYFMRKKFSTIISSGLSGIKNRIMKVGRR